MSGKLVGLVRLLLGTQYVLSGLNWWVKILPFPSVSDPPAPTYKHEIVGAMIHSGWMFGATKVVELATGIALLLNIFVPLMLVVSFPVALTTFILDALIFSTLSGWIMGQVSTAVALDKLWDAYFLGGMLIAMQAYLMFAYFDRYRPMLAFRARPDAASGGRAIRTPGWMKAAMAALGVFALVSGVLALAIMAPMMVQQLRR